MKRRIRLTENQLKDIVKESIEKVLNEDAALKLDYYEESAPMLTEMARIDVPNRDSVILGTREIWVYGQDRSSMTPHFHYFNKKNKPFDVEVNIKDLSICFSQPRNGVPENKLKSWFGLTADKKALDKWLQQRNSDLPTITNYEAIKLAWNQNNRDNTVE